MKILKYILVTLAFLPTYVFAVPSSVDRVTDHIEPLIKTDGIIVNASSSLRALSSIFSTSTNATTTNLSASNSFKMSSDFITDLTGTGLTVTGGALTNSGVISNSCPGGFLSCSGTNPSSFTLGTLGAANGGTGNITNSVGDILIGTGVPSWSRLTMGTNGFILMASAAGEQWVATTTFSGGLTYLSGNVTINNGAISTGQIATSTFNANQLIWFNNSTGVIEGTSTVITVGRIIATSTTVASQFPVASTTALSVSGALMVNAASSSINNLQTVFSSTTALTVTGALMVNAPTSTINYLSLISATSTGLSYFPGGLIANAGSSTITYLIGISATTTGLAYSPGGIIVNAASSTITYLMGISATTTGLAYAPGGMIINNASSSINNLQNIFASSTAISITGMLNVNNGTSTVTNLTMVSATSTTLAVTSSSTIANARIVNASSTALTVDGVASTTVLRVDRLADGCINITSGLIGTTGVACASTGASNSKWATSTLPLSGIFPNVATYVGIGTTTPRFNLQLASSTALQLVLSDGTVNTGFGFRNTAGTLYIDGTSPTTFATTSAIAPLFTLRSSTGNVGIGTSSPYAILSVVGATGVVANIYTATSTTVANQFPVASTTALSVTGALMVNNASSSINVLNTVFSSSTVESNTGTSLFSTTDSVFGIGTTTVNYANLMINPIAGKGLNILAVGSSTGLRMLMDNTGRLVVGASTTPYAQFSVNTTAGLDPFAIGSSTRSYFGLTQGGTIYTCETKPATSTSMAFDWGGMCSTVTYQMGTSAFTINVKNATSSIYSGSSKKVWVCNPGGTAGAITWTGVEWGNGGTMPAQTTTTNVCDLWTLTVGSGTSTSAYKVFGQQSPNFP